MPTLLKMAQTREGVKMEQRITESITLSAALVCDLNYTGRNRKFEICFALLL
jgi:hypothetical protein